MEIDLLKPNRDDLLKKWEKELEAVAHLNKWDLPEELAWWAEYASTRSRILELGSYNGASTKIMLLANPEAQIHVIDLWEDANTYETFCLALGEHFGKRIFYDRRSTEEGLFLLEQGEFHQYFDGLMIDAGHTKELVSKDILLSQPLMRPKSLICGHDYHPSWSDNGVSQAVIELLTGHSNPCASIWAYQMP